MERKRIAVNPAKIIPRFVADLYASLDILVREEWQNGRDAVRELQEILKDETRNKPWIRQSTLFNITVNSLNKITFRDFGLGMTRKILVNHFWQICCSSKEEKDYLIGQFGIGALAKVYICSSLSLRSRNIEDGTTLVSTMDMNILDRFEETTGKRIPATNPTTEYTVRVLPSDSAQNLECQGTEIVVEFPEALTIETLQGYISELIAASKYTKFQTVIKVEEPSLVEDFTNIYKSNPFQTPEQEMVVFPQGYKSLGKKKLGFKWLNTDCSLQCHFVKYQDSSNSWSYRVVFDSFYLDISHNQTKGQMGKGWVEVSPVGTAISIFKEGYYCAKFTDSLDPSSYSLTGELDLNWIEITASRDALHVQSTVYVKSLLRGAIYFLQEQLIQEVNRERNWNLLQVHHFNSGYIELIRKHFNSYGERGLLNFDCCLLNGDTDTISVPITLEELRRRKKEENLTIYHVSSCNSAHFSLVNSNHVVVSLKDGISDPLGLRVRWLQKFCGSVDRTAFNLENITPLNEIDVLSLSSSTKAAIESVASHLLFGCTQNYFSLPAVLVKIFVCTAPRTVHVHSELKPFSTNIPQEISQNAIVKKELHLFLNAKSEQLIAEGNNIIRDAEITSGIILHRFLKDSTISYLFRNSPTSFTPTGTFSAEVLIDSVRVYQFLGGGNPWDGPTESLIYIKEWRSSPNDVGYYIRVPGRYTNGPNNFEPVLKCTSSVFWDGSPLRLSADAGWNDNSGTFTYQIEKVSGSGQFDTFAHCPSGKRILACWNNYAYVPITENLWNVLHQNRSTVKLQLSGKITYEHNFVIPTFH